MGAVDYITKPISPSIVKARVRNHLELKRAREELEKQNEILEQKVKERTKEIKETQKETLFRLTNTAELRDTDTGMHIRRIQHYSELIAQKLGLNSNDSEELGLASMMHDMGKIGIPDNILLKPGKLDEEEWEIMKTHSAIGAKCLEGSRSRMLAKGRTIALHHHEKWDGSGYPSGLQREDISIEGRIVCLVDVFDALTTERPYKKAWPIEKAVDTIKSGRSTQFDPELVDLFIDNISEIIKIRENFYDEKM